MVVIRRASTTAQWRIRLSLGSVFAFGVIVSALLVLGFQKDFREHDPLLDHVRVSPGSNSGRKLASEPSGVLLTLKQQTKISAQSPKEVQPNKSNTDRKEGPYALLHVGPKKTASTTIQVGLSMYAKQLFEDNVVYFSRLTTWNIGVWFEENEQHVEKRWTECREWAEFIGFLFKAKLRGQNIIISHEGYWGPHMIAAYKKELSTFRVTVVVCYRRWFEWIPSMYWENNKRKLRSGEISTEDRHLEKVVPFLRQEMNRPHATARRQREFLGVFDDIQILNMHDVGGNLQKYFMCKVLQNAPHACAAVTQSGRRNAKDTMHYAIIAEAAFQRSLVDASRFQFNQTIQLIENYHQKTLGLTLNDLPTTCLTPKEQEQLLNHSITWERRLVPEWASTDGIEAVHREKFERATTTTLCDVDADAVLSQEKWKMFFANIGKWTTY